MSLLDRWRHLAEVGTVISCPTMRLDGNDWEKPVVEGRGEIRVTSTDEFTYILRGAPDDLGHLHRCLNRQRDNPYDGRLHFRLNVVDSDGTDLSCGYTIPKIEPAADGDWTFSGEFDALVLMTEKPKQVGTENVYLIPRSHIVRTILRRFVRTDDGNGGYRPEHRMDVLSSILTFTFDDDAGTLSIHATGSAALPQTYTENWLGEPLRIMFGQLVFPRIVARANPDRTMVWVRPSRKWYQDSDWAALWQGPEELSDKDGFWRLYAALITFVATAFDKSGHSNFEGTKVTHLYEEIIQASLGSRWVWGLTFASSVEGLVKLIVPRGTKRATANEKAIADMVEYIDKWPGSDGHLKGVARNAVKRTAETSTIQALRDLRAAGVVTKDQVHAWETVRNQVMHGSLISRYSTAEDDKLMLDLAGLLHALTRHLVFRSTGASDPSDV